MGRNWKILGSALAFAAVSVRAEEVELDATADTHAAAPVEQVGPMAVPPPAKWVSGTPDTDPKCVLNRNDPGSIGPVVVEKKMLGMGYKGACIDEGERRALIPLGEADRARFAAQPGEVVVGNWSYIDENGKRDFGVAKYRPEDLMPGGVWLEHFDEHLKGDNIIKKTLRKLTWKVAHIAQMACFKPGHEMTYYPENGSLRLPPRKVSCIALSGEAVPIKGLSKLAPKLLLFEGLRPKAWQPFALTMRGMSFDYKRDEVLKNSKLGGMGRTIDFIPTTEEFTQNYFRNYPALSGKIRSQTMYSTLGKSCVGVFNWVSEMGLKDPKRGAKERKLALRSPGSIEKAVVAIGARDYQRPIVRGVGLEDGSIKVENMPEGTASQVDLPVDTDVWGLSKYENETIGPVPEIIGPPVPKKILKQLHKKAE